MSVKKKFFEFAVWLTVVYLFLLLVYQATYLLFPDLPVATFVLYIFLVPYILNLIIYFLLLKGMTLEPAYFIQIIILSIVVKLVLFGAFNFIMIYLSPENAEPNVVVFMIVYVLSTALELLLLVPLINKQQKSVNPAADK